jgi:hypothetical protein
MKTVSTVILFIVLLIYGLAVRTIAQNLGRGSAAQTELIGTWRVVSIGTVRPNGQVVTEWMGSNPTGTLIYDRAGRMSVQFMRDPRATWKAAGPSPAHSPDEIVDAASAAEKAAAFDAYYAYYGEYDVNKKDHVVRHHVEGSLWPPEIGVTYERHFDVSGNRLAIVTAPFKFKGEERYNRIVLQRISN